jgi:hypothetical protein
VQQFLPWNPQKLRGSAPALAFNTAASFTTNTNWQNYAGEATMSYLTQMAGLAYHNFASAAVGIALAIAFIRGIARREKNHRKFLGRYDAGHAVGAAAAVHCRALLLVSQGVVQNLKPYDTAKAGRAATGAENWGRRQAGERARRQAGDGHRDARRPSRKGPSLRRRSSRNWAPTAAASSTPTARIRLKIPLPHEFLEMF